MLLTCMFFVSFWLPGEWLPPSPSPQNQPAIRLNQEQSSPHYGTIEVFGLTSDVLNGLSSKALTAQGWQAVFPVYTGERIPSSGDQPPLLGTYTIEADLIRFKPRFPLVRGLAYTARVDLDILFVLIERMAAGRYENLEATFALSKSSTAATTVVAQVYPSTDQIPENQLKFYIHFSTPMKRGQAYQMIRLVDAEGRPVAAPFLELAPELWDSKTQRLTLLFDPGRIKRGLRPHEDLGMALQKGRSYRLEIAKDMLDAQGQVLAKAFEKNLAVVAADRTSPDYTSWSLTAPSSNTHDPVVLGFVEPLDHGLLSHLFEIQDVSGEVVSGEIKILDQETKWQFVPNKPWQTGGYTLKIDARLEDLAGNTLNYLFDVDIQQEGNLSPDQAPVVTLQFEVNLP